MKLGTATTSQPVTEATVRSISSVEHEKFLRLDNGDRIAVHRFAAVGEGDNIVISESGGRRKVIVPCLNGRATIEPFYDALEAVDVGFAFLRVRTKEITQPEELRGYAHLAEFHYRGGQAFGRRALLISILTDVPVPVVVGYVELTTAFMLNTPRARLFDRPFVDRTGRISWKRWDLNARKQFTNAVVRISRCVVHPEFRGLGLAQRLVRHAAIFCRQHWQVSGLRPEFLEITADMLKFVPFVEKAGMQYMGDTTGNLRRLHRDLRYLLDNRDRIQAGELLGSKPRRGRKDSRRGAIINLQVKYADLAKDMIAATNDTLESFLAGLPRSVVEFGPEQYSVLGAMARLPKPNYILGLSEESRSYVNRRLRDLELHTAVRHGTQGPTSRRGCISFANAVIEYPVPSPPGDAAFQVHKAFGLDGLGGTQRVLSLPYLDIAPGSIVMIWGPSGSGKTSMLEGIRLVAEGRRPEWLYGRLEVRGRVEVAEFLTRSAEPLIDVVSRGGELGEGLKYLNLAGLSEPTLYVRSFDEVSAGQKYRAKLAKLLYGGADIWLCDEFCSSLDVLTAAVVAGNLQKHARREGVTVLLASPRLHPIAWVLKPDMIVALSAGAEPCVFSGKELQRFLKGEQARWF